MLDDATRQSILDAVTGRQEANTIIITFANYAYLDILVNWLVAVDKLGIGNYLIFSLDRQIFEFLSERDFPTVLLPVYGNFQALWTMRVEVFAFVSANGIDFVHTDVDALWFRDPIREFFVEQESAVVFSQGTVWPPIVHRAWGFVLCCGLFYIRSQPGTATLFENWKTNIQMSGDDQHALNVALASGKLSWDTDEKDAYLLRHQNYKFLCFNDVIRGTVPASGMSVALLPHHLFQRVPVEEPSPYVRHLLSPKNSEAKMKVFADTGCLFLDGNWKSIDFDADTIGRVGMEAHFLQGN